MVSVLRFQRILRVQRLTEITTSEYDDSTRVLDDDESTTTDSEEIRLSEKAGRLAIISIDMT